MSYWSGITRNLIMQNSAPVRQHGGDLGSTTWSYVVGKDGVKTIDPIVGFYLNPPPDSRCRWSTQNGRYHPKHIIISGGDCNEDAMPPRELVDWNDDIIQAKVEQYRHPYWEDLKYLVRPNTFEDLYELFDSATLWNDGAYNLWKLVNALITLAHDQFPHVLQEWKNHIGKVVCDVFRPATEPYLGRNMANNKMEVRLNQQVLIEWDRIVDPLVLLQRTTFPVGNLPFMSVQQHGLLREFLICEHVRLSGTQSSIPRYYNYSRPDINTASDFVETHLQRAPVIKGIQPGSNDVGMQITFATNSTPQPNTHMPLVVVGTNNPDSQLRAQPRNMPDLSKEPHTSATTIHVPALTSPFLASLPGIPEAATIKTREVPNRGVIEPENPPSKDERMSSVAMTFIPKSIGKTASVTVAAKTSKFEYQVESHASEAIPDEAGPIMEAQPAKAEALTAGTLIKVPALKIGASPTEVESPIPRIATEEATPPLDNPLRDHKDSNGSINKLFFPDTPSGRPHAGRQQSVASAPDQDTEPMLTGAERNVRIVSETPPAMQDHCGQQQYTCTSASSDSFLNEPSNQGLHRLPVSGYTQVQQQSGPTGYQMQPIPQRGRHMGPTASHSSAVMPSFGPLSGMLRGSGSFNPSPHSRQAGSNGLVRHYGQPPPQFSMPMVPSMNRETGPLMRPPFQDQMPLHVDQQFYPHGPPISSQCFPSYQPNGYVHQHLHYVAQSDQDDNGYSSNGYRNSSNSGGPNNHDNGKRRDSIQSIKSRKNRMSSSPGAIHSMSRQANTGFSGRRPPISGRPDQNQGRTGSSNCRNERGLPYQELFNSHFEECSCVRCLENSRSVYITLRPQGKKPDGDLERALLRHFAQFNPVSAKIRHKPSKLNCLIE